MLKKLLLASLFTTSYLFASSVNIAVASNLSYTMNDLQKEFNKLYPNTKIKITFASSKELTTQIKNKIPYDIFLAANMEYPKELYQEGLAITRPIIYAQGKLAILSPNQRSFHKNVNLIDSLLIKKIATANPKKSPYGKASIEAIKNANVYEKVQKKLIYANSISQVVMYTTMASDVGFIAKSSLYSPKMTKYKHNVHWIEVDSKLYTPIKQGIVLLKNGQSKSEASAFFSFMLSKKAKKIMQNYGYLVP